MGIGGLDLGRNSRRASFTERMFTTIANKAENDQRPADAITDKSSSEVPGRGDSMRHWRGDWGGEIASQLAKPNTNMQQVLYTDWQLSDERC